MSIPDIRYARSEEAAVAYRILGEDGPPLLRVGGVVTSLALDEMLVQSSTYLHAIAGFCRLICFDRRGHGLSERTESAPSVEEQLADMEAVRAHAGFERVAVFGESVGGIVALLYAATFPHRVSHLILADTMVCDAVDPLAPKEQSRPMFGPRLLEAADADPVEFARRSGRLIAPDEPERHQQSIASYLLSAAGPAGYSAAMHACAGIDARPWLGLILAPTLVMHSEGDLVVPVTHGRYIGANVRRAETVIRPGRAHLLWIENLEESLAPVAVFLHVEPLGTGAKIGMPTEWARQVSNLWPPRCERGALPLSYAPERHSL